MPDPFSSARLLVSGAHEDIYKLDAQTERFFHSEPYAYVVEHDRKRGVDIHKLKMTKKLPVYVSRDVARIGSDLRSALDQAGYATAVASRSKRLRYTYFPFGASARHLDDVIRGRCKDLPGEIVTFFRSLKPYRGGDDMLWAVNEIANGIKHRFIVPVGQGVGGGIIHDLYAEKLVDFRFPPVWDTSKDEIVLFTVVQGTESKHDFSLGFYIAFGEVEVVKGQSVTPTLTALANKVGTIINETEDEARRIGLII